MKLILDIIIDALIDTAKMLPFLFAAFLLMEAFEHHSSEKLRDLLAKAGSSRIGGPAVGALLGCIPQCGLSAASANLYAGQMITPGTLMAVFIATSDEAIPVLLANPSIVASVWKLLVCKVIIALISGFLFDFVIKLLKVRKEDEPFEEICAECGCGSHGIVYSSFKHTLNIALFILIVNLVLGAVMGFAGEDNVFAFLEGTGIFQPFLTALIGLVPNCAASVAITQLYAAGGITFGAAVGGLSTGAGVGLAVLFKANDNMKENMLFLGYLYVSGVVFGLILNFLPF